MESHRRRADRDRHRLTILGLGALAGVWALVWKRRRILADAALPYATCVAIVLVFGKVASPQFLVWLAPLVAVVRGRSGLVACLLCAGACVLTRLVYPVRYGELLTGDRLPATLLTLRNVLLVAVVLVLTVALVRRSGSRRTTTGAPVTVLPLSPD